MPRIILALLVLLFGPTTAPYDPLFKRLQDNWNEVSGVAADRLKEDSLSKFDWRKNRGLFLDNGQRRCFSFVKGL